LGTNPNGRSLAVIPVFSKNMPTSTIKTFDTFYEPAVFQWWGTDPAANGWTKVGSGTTAASGDAWQINTLASNAATYYKHKFWFNNAFIDGISIKIQAPNIIATDGAALPNKSVIVACDDGTHRFEMLFDANFVYLNGGTARAHNNGVVILIVVPGGATANMFIAMHQVETAKASIATVANELIFGDRATNDDANTTWSLINWWNGITDEGETSLVTGQTVKLYDATVDAAAGDITTISDSDNDAIYPSQSISVAASTLVRMRVESYRGMSWFTENRSDA